MKSILGSRMVGLAFCFLLVVSMGCGEKKVAAPEPEPVATGEPAADMPPFPDQAVQAVDEPGIPPEEIRPAPPPRRTLASRNNDLPPTRVEKSPASAFEETPSEATVPDTPEQLAEFVRNRGSLYAAIAQLEQRAREGRLSADEAAYFLQQPGPARALGARALALLGTEEAVTELIQRIAAESDEWTKQDMVDAGFGISHTNVASLLFAALTPEGDPYVNSLAQRALANMADESLLDDLQQRYAASTNQEAQWLLADAVRHVAATNLALKLISLAQTGGSPTNDSLTAAALDTLGVLGTLESTEYLLRQLSTATDAAEIRGLTGSVNLIINPESLNLLRTTAETASAGLASAARVAAVLALANFDDSEVRILVNNLALYDTDPAVQKAAQQTLRRLNGEIPTSFEL